MHRLFKTTKLLFVASVALTVGPSVAFAQHYNQKNLVSNLVLPDNPDHSKVILDPNLKNPWGMTRSAGSPWWIGNNNSGTSTLYDGSGNPISIFPDPHPDTNGNNIDSPFNNFVFVPPPGFAPGTQSAPTGVVFNGSPTDFILDKGTPAGKQAIFIFATEDGTISGWNPVTNIPAGSHVPSINAVLEVDNSDGGSTKGAVYKGATSAEIDGQKFLYVTNFRSARVEVYDTNFKRVHLDEDAFDPDGDGDREGGDRESERVPHGFAPFNIQNIGGSLFVTYAKQDALRHDPVGGDGFGFVEIFTPTGKHIGHLQHGPWMNAPWGVVWTPRDFGKFSNSILVGNFRSGWIASFNGFTHKFEGFVQNPDSSLVFIDGLWSLTFGNNGNAGSSNTLFFTAGLNGEQDGLFGTLTPVPAEEDGSIE
jgi:uncharacterized protein (TIGR03118 family)